MSQPRPMKYDLKKDISSIRAEFPILKNYTYLISNSLGAVPKKVQIGLNRYYHLWENEGVKAWKKEWWDLSQKVSSELEEFLKAEKQSITMMPNATISHWVALSTAFPNPKNKRDKIIMTGLDFPSSIYAVSKIAEFMGWKLEIVKSENPVYLETDKITQKIDDSTLFVATSHVCFKSAFIQDLSSIVEKARKTGTKTVIDGYHAPGILPVNLKESGIDFYIGGCLKWLCGGPGNAFLYIRPELSNKIQPSLSGWFAHENPFAFDLDLKYTSGPYRFMSGTPPIPALYTATAGLKIIRKIGIKNIRKKSVSMTEKIIEKSRERQFSIYSPLPSEIRGGAVSVHIPHAFPIKQALERKKILVDFRKGKTDKEDVIRIAPHFYNEEKEVEYFFNQVEEITSSGEYKKFPDKIEHVT